MDDTNTTPAAQPRPDRFLIGIVVGLVALVLAAGISVAFLRQPARELPADTPGGTVQRFYAALEQKDYAGAYSYLSDSMANKPSRDQFISYQANQGSYRSQQRVRIQDEKVTGNEGTVTLVITTFYNGGPFGGSNNYNSTQVFTLRRDGSTWRITGLPPDYIPYPSS